MLNRRRMLQGAASLGALTATETGHASSTPSVPAAGPFTVRREEGRADSPWVLAKHFPVLAKISAADTGGRYAMVQAVQPPDTGPAMHIHPTQNEWFFVLSGVVGVRLADQDTILKAGDSLMAPRGVAHAYVTLGSEDASLLFLYDPAGDMEAYFKEMSQIKELGEGPVDPAVLERAFTRHGMRMTGPPLRAAEFKL